MLLSSSGFGPEGLAYATSISAVFEVGMLLLIQNKKGNKLVDREFWKTFIRIAIAATLAGIVSWVMTKILPLRESDNSFLATFPKFCVITLVSLLIYIISCSLLRIDEIKPFTARVKKILFRNINDSSKN